MLDRLKDRKGHADRSSPAAAGQFALDEIALNGQFTGSRHEPLDDRHPAGELDDGRADEGPRDARTCGAAATTPTSSFAGALAAASLSVRRARLGHPRQLAFDAQINTAAASNGIIPRS